ncbi:hypothetical protein [Brevibacillus massiliensis]|uniref:hypothetical protein n=1 Tax=Brevibacillus massiliensis TaxID=1118054 RepID=UPI0003166C7A|nr:hypothetical protein [Brevibacillus massiliensis]
MELQKKFVPINDQLALFHEEYYMTILAVSLEGHDADERGRLFDTLYAFQSSDIELEIDVSEESRQLWYLQLLVPYMLTLADAARKRIERGRQALEAYLEQHQIRAVMEPLRGDDIFAYVKRYNPEATL